MSTTTDAATNSTAERSRLLLPNFVYVGAHKSGSSWLFEALLEHPEVYVPIAKDVEYFDFNYHRGVEWYAKHFSKGKGFPAIGEVSPNYMMYPEVAERIYDTLGSDIKLIACLREPGDISVSGFNYFRIHGDEWDGSFEDFLETEHGRNQLDYFGNLKRYYDLYPSEQIYIAFYEDLKADSASFISGIYEFLEVDPDFRPDVLTTYVNAAKTGRSKGLTKMAYSTAKVLRHFGFANIVGAVKRNPVFESLFYSRLDSQATKADISQEALYRLRRKECENYGQLEELIGKSLPPHWYEVTKQPTSSESQ